MNRIEFSEFVKGKYIFMDGATGSNLVKKGLKSGECPETWILNNKDALIELQQNYVQSGSNIILAPTFTSNRIKLKEYNLQDDIVKINTQLVELSKIAAGKRALVAGDVTMTGIQLKPIGTLEFEELVDVYKEQITILDKAGVDLLVVETMMSLQETRAALIAAKEVCDLPVLCTLTFESDGRTLYGSDATTCAVVLEKLGASAIGANCSSGPSKMAEVIKKMSSVCSVPIIAKPNAGMPYLDKDGNTVYDMDPVSFANECRELINSGASILGGCCGTSPEYIKELVKVTSEYEYSNKECDKNVRYLSSEKKTLSFIDDGHFIVVGERINPTGKKKLQSELKEDKLDMVMQYVEEQEECGASVLDINVGMSGIDENAMMLKVIECVSNMTALPLSIDTSSVNVLENALRRYPGRALVNSVSCEENIMLDKLKAAKKYGAMIIVLPLSDKGLPATYEEKIENINKVLNKAYELGFTPEDIVIDGLVSTIGANKNAAIEVLDTIRYAKANGLCSTCGLSNISFGLPERQFVNTAFLTMAIKEGLTMAIMNPGQELLMNAVYASDLLCNKKDSDVKYIERMNDKKYTLTQSVDSNTQTKENTQSKDSDILYYDVLKGKRDSIIEHTKAQLIDRDANDILNGSLLRAIEDVGELFNSGKYYLPQLISSAETMKSAIEYLEPYMLKSKENTDSPVIVIATVKGDIHDIGKNLVSLMLRNHGFKVIDLGKDVDKEDIIDAAIKNNASIIGLSALMTTTMSQMKEVVMYAKEMNVNAKIMIGGAVITEDYAKEIGADAYSKDAADAVAVAKRLLKEYN